jgi:4-hydroxy-tetrahydrodipicolinate synthase
MSDKTLHGVVVPVLTPIDKNENVDEASFRMLLRHLLKAEVDGIFVGGSAGEGPLLAQDQWQRMCEIAHDEVRDAVPLLGGVMDTSTRRVCDKIKILRKVGYHYFVVTPTYYTAIKTAEEHLRLFGAAKDAVGDEELIAYNIPQCVGSSFAIDTLCEMAKRGWIRNCKESSGIWEYHQELLQKAADVGLTVLIGDEVIGGQALLAGAKGIVPVCANYDPAIFKKLYFAGKQGDQAGVDEAMKRIIPMRNALVLSGPCWLAGIKYAMSAIGIGSPQTVSPLEPSGAQSRAEIDAVVKSDLAAGIVKMNP